MQIVQGTILILIVSTYEIKQLMIKRRT
jgi:hypothetical protein